MKSILVVEASVLEHIIAQLFEVIVCLCEHLSSTLDWRLDLEKLDFLSPALLEH